MMQDARLWSATAVLLMAATASTLGRAGPQQGIHEAAARGDIEEVRVLLDRDPQLVDARDRYGWSPLHRASINGHADVVGLLIERGAQLEARDNAGMSALHHAARSGSHEVARRLVHAGADVNAVSDEGATPLALAVMGKHDRLTELLIAAGAVVPHEGERARRLLHAAAAAGNGRFVGLMLSDGVDPGSLNDNGGSLLHSAAAGGDVELARSLVERGFSLQARDRYRMTTLHVAAFEGHAELVEQLIEAGADPRASTPAGQTPLHFARLNGRDAVVELLAGLAGGGAAQPVLTDLAGDYFGQPPPGRSPELLGLGIVSSYLNDHGALTFAPDGRAAYWSPILAAGLTVLEMRREGDRWTVPEPAGFADPRFDDYSAVVSPDGARLFFTSRRPLETGGTPLPWLGGLRIWRVERQVEGWSAPRPLDASVSAGDEFALSVSADGTLYFSSLRAGGLGSMDIYRARWQGGRFQAPENLGAAINSEHTEDGPAVAPDEGILVFGSFRPDGLGGSDLYVSFRAADGSWTAARNLGTPINSSSFDGQPFLTRDGKYLIFASSRNGNRDYYWIDAAVLRDVRR